MSPVSWYVALRHVWPVEVPLELKRDAERLRFARWLVVSGLLSDWPASPVEETIGGQ